MMDRLFFFLILTLLSLIAACGIPVKDNYLENDKIKIEISESGPVIMKDKLTGYEFKLEQDHPKLVVDGEIIDLNEQNCSSINKNDTSLEFNYNDGEFSVALVYELKEGWRFVSRQMRVTALRKQKFVVNQFTLLDALSEKDSTYVSNLNYKKYGILLDLKKPVQDEEGIAVFMTVQNPFSEYTFKEKTINIEYFPGMKWDQKYGDFRSDRLCIGFADLLGKNIRASMLPEWKYHENPDQFIESGDRTDLGVIAALTECTRAFLLVHPKQSNRVHVGWTENDYQIDISTPEGNAEYKRIIDRAVELGSRHLLMTPSNSAVAPLNESRDAWGWENLLWFNMGQKLRKGEWKPGDPLPESVQDILDYAESKKIGLLAYVFPSLPFMQNPEWTAWRTTNGQKPEGYTTVDTGIRSFQDWLVEKIIAFCQATGATGVSFDHWWIAYENNPGDTGVQVSSKYQQWYGCRRIMEQLREKNPDIIIDGRQQYHHFGTWTWLAGTYPHPMMSDEQPGSFNAIPDLSTDRVNGARQRYVAYRLMTHDFTPVEIMPGFITHQTQRLDAEDKLHWDRFRENDWDYLGWKYNLISSVATAPFNHVINYIPARNKAEFHSFSEEDKKFFNEWLDFTDEKAEYMQHVKPIIGQPMVGRCDGTSAIMGNNGFLFVFNPNYRPLTAQFTLNESIGLTQGDKFILKEIYPGNGIIIPQGVLKYGQGVELPMDGITAKVFKLEPWTDLTSPLLINTAGDCNLKAGKLSITGVKGEVGSEREISVILPENEKVKQLFVNGRELKFQQVDNKISTSVRFKGKYFPKAYSLVPYNPHFTENSIETKLRVPDRIFQQMGQRKKDWPISYSKDDKIAPWLDPSRLLLYIQIAEPYRDVRMEETRGEHSRVRTIQKPIRKEEYKVIIDGVDYEIHEAYNGVYPTVERSNLGVFVDISSLSSGAEHHIKVKLPVGLKPGQFQGIFIEHVENEFTTDVNN